MKWAEITIEAAADSAEAVTAALLDAGCQGVAEQGEAIRTIRGFLPPSDSKPKVMAALKKRLQRMPEFGLQAPTALRYATVDDEDWANAWKQHYKPLLIGRRLAIKPSWELFEDDGSRAVVTLDPGMAFGTGGHPTTRLCLELLERYVAPGMTVADVGTGSGILALAAARLGAARVHATDIDSLPREISRQNVAMNGLEAVVSIHEMEAFDSAARECDLVAANILASVIIDLLPSIRQRMKPGALFLGSGIVAERLPEVLQAVAASGLDLVEVREDEIWRAVVGRRP